MGLGLLVWPALAHAAPPQPSTAHVAALTPSPDDWRDLVIYQVITDRFSDGNPANNGVEGNYAPADGFRIHGGDFAGLEARLDYLVHLGVDAVWISPVVLNVSAAYHGYAARDFFTIAPHFGGLPGLRSFVSAAHARGLRVILDVVMNHMGDLIYSPQGGYPNYNYPTGYTLAWRNASRYAGVFNDLTKFHNYGQIGNYVDPEQILGELAGLDDLKTEDPTVIAALQQAANFLVDSTDCDGFRVDTVKHVDMAFWNAWCPSVHAHAAAAGKSNFLLFGEVFDGSDAKVGSYTGTQGGGAYKFDSMLHYPMYYTASGVFAFDQPPVNLANEWGQLGNYDPASREQLVTFLDNHDNARFASFGVANQDEGRARAALGWLLTARGVPCVYYGTEQEFDGGGDPYCREDMWDGQWDFGPSDLDNFDLAHPLFQFTQAVTAARRAHPALRRGATTEIYSENAGPGLEVFRRDAACDTVVVAVNTSNGPLTRTLGMPWPAGTVLGDALDAGARDSVAAGGFLSLKVPARGVRILESVAFEAQAAPAHLAVRTIYPGHDQSVNDLASPMRVVFDRNVDPVTLELAFHTAPAVPGFWQVNGALARFFPYSGWPTGQIVSWWFDTSLRGADGSALVARWDARFRTTPYATGISLPGGYVADRIARQGLGAPDGILAAPWVSPDALLLSDVSRQKLFTLTPGVDLGHFVGDARWGKPEGIARAADGRVLVEDQNGLFAVDARRMTTALLGGSATTNTGALAVGGADFGNLAYLGDPANDRVTKLTAGGVLQPFATGINGAEGLTFGPGGAWGTDLYVADANLTSIGGNANGPGRIARVTPLGAVSALVTDGSLLAGASAMAFDPTGRFGGNLFVADILGERILQVTPAGALSVFATGFRNLAGSSCMAFGADGALYVADAGYAVAFSKPAFPSGVDSLPSVWRIASTAPVAGVGRRVTGTGLALSEGRPQPSRGAVTFTLSLARAARVRVEVLDLTGRRVRTLVDEPRPAGTFPIAWRGAGAAPGLYFIRASADREQVTRRVVRLK